MGFSMWTPAAAGNPYLPCDRAEAVFVRDAVECQAFQSCDVDMLREQFMPEPSDTGIQGLDCASLWGLSRLAMPRPSVLYWLWQRQGLHVLLVCILQF
jgi:hypothetical protein